MTSLPILTETQSLHEGQWWEAEANGRVHCYLCPRHCHIHEGQSGFCFIRVNRGGKLYSLGYGAPAALQVDPIEKKPLNHFCREPVSSAWELLAAIWAAFSARTGTFRKSRQDQVKARDVPPEAVPELALNYGCDSIAFTYNEPTIWGEYVIDICRAAKSYGLKTVMVSNGYIEGSISRYLQPHRCRQCGSESLHGKFLRKNHADPLAAGPGDFVAAQE
jgi:pyruvate formate lyase activating enzyme